MIQRIRQFTKQRWQQWLSRRIPPVREVTLNQRRIFIFLSRHGMIASLVVLALFIGGINYGNNLLLGLCFFIASLFVIVIHHTYSNLSGLRITAVSVSSAFAGETARFRLCFDDARYRRHESLVVEWEGVVTPISLVAEPFYAEIELTAPKRGWYRPPRLRLSSEYPLGWVQAWTWLDMDLAALVYPAPEQNEVIPVGAGGDGEGRKQRVQGQDDFEALKTFTPGDSLAHISWKHLARGQGLQTKTYTGEEAGSNMLDWDALPGLPIETRLSRLTWWVLQLSRHNLAYGLRLPGQQISSDAGLEHRDNCLKALALFGRSDSGSGNADSDNQRSGYLV